MQKLTEQQIETIKEQIDDSISMGAMNLKVGIVLKGVLNEALTIPAVVGQSEQLVSFLRQYQKTCEIMHVNKIDAKNFVEQYKTN